MKRREIMRRVLAAGLCLCVCAGLAELALPALASAGAVSSTNFYVEHIYLGNVGLSQSGYINNISYDSYGTPYGSGRCDSETRGAKVEPGESYGSFDFKSGDMNDYGAFIYPTEQTYFDDTFMAEVTEKYTGYEIADGNEAVEWVEPTGDETGRDAGHFHIKYNADVQNVVLYLFYSYDGQTLLGANFGTDLDGVPGVSADQDVLEVTEDNIGDIKKAAEDKEIEELEDVEVGDVIYNTGAGLHTEKRVSADVLEDGRTFDVGLESWYAAPNNAANVGFILDSSGSMAFVPDPTSAGTGVEPRVITKNDKMYDKVEDYAGDFDRSFYLSIPWDTLQRDNHFSDADIMAPGNTDNSPLAYTNYSYYVYDSRETVQELVPLAYWDGTMDGADNPLQTGLVGLYQFKHDGSGDPDYFKNGAVEGASAGPVDGDRYATGTDLPEPIPRATCSISPPRKATARAATRSAIPGRC